MKAGLYILIFAIINFLGFMFFKRRKVEKLFGLNTGKIKELSKRIKSEVYIKRMTDWLTPVLDVMDSGRANWIIGIGRDAGLYENAKAKHESTFSTKFEDIALSEKAFKVYEVDPEKYEAEMIKNLDFTYADSINNMKSYKKEINNILYSEGITPTNEVYKIIYKYSV